ncbi:MAG TPA: O-antigen ligase family protein [Chryseosolibacter sp.]
MKSNLQLYFLLALAVLLVFGVGYSQNEAGAWFVLEKKIFFFLIPLALATSAISTPALPKILARLFCLTCFCALVVCYFYSWQQWRLFEDGKIGSAAVNYLSSSELWNVETAKPWLFFSYVSLSGGIGMHPTYLGMYCAFACMIMIIEHREANTRLIKALMLVAILFFSISIIFLAARIIIVLLATVCVMLLLYELFVEKARIKTALTLPVLLVILLAGVLVNPVTRYRQVNEIIATGISVHPGTHYTNSTSIRTSLWWLASQAYFESNPFIGTGAGDVQQSMQKASKQFGITNVLATYDPHSQYLFLLLSSGAVGLGLFLGYVTIGFAKAWQSRDIRFLSFLLLVAAVWFTETALELQKGIVFFSVFFSSMSFVKAETSIVPSLPQLANAGR